MIRFLVARISKSRTLVKLVRIFVVRVPLFAVLTKSLIIKAFPENRWPPNPREIEVLSLLSKWPRSEGT